MGSARFQRAKVQIKIGLTKPQPDYFCVPLLYYTVYAKLGIFA